MINILEFCGFDKIEDDPMGDFLSSVANGPLLKLAGVRQTGVHHGQTIYSHLLNVVMTTDLAAQIVGCNAVERRILICAATLHDLNKLDSEGRPISKVANTEEIPKFLERFGLNAILPDSEMHIESVRRLIAAHSGHLHQGADSLLPISGPVSRERLRNILIPLLQLADQADVAREFADDRKREQVLMSLNAASGTQYRWEWHRLNEYRGPFSNLIHNAAIEEMREQLKAVPFLHYGEGTFYLVPADSPSALDEKTYLKVSERLSKSLKRLKGGNASDFVSGSPVGIKINPEIFATGLTLEDAFVAAARITQGRAYKGEAIEEMEKKARRRAGEGYEKLCDDNGNLFSRDPEIMRVGEILRTVYNFLQAHCSIAFKGKNKKYADAWQPIYLALELDPKPEWALLDALNDRAYVIARSIPLDFGEVLEKAVALTEEFEEGFSLRQAGQGSNAAFVEYAQSALIFSCLIPSRVSFLKHLEIYGDPQIEPCALCSMPLPAQPMMAGDVPKGLIVAQFSNRNLAGTGDPKRNSCPICREQLLIEKIGFAPAQSKGFYLHIYPETFASPLFLNAMRRTFDALVKNDTRTLLFDTRKIAREYEDAGTLRLSFKTKATGLALPLYSELVGNIITLPLYPLGDNDAERYLFALQYSIFIHQRFSQRVVLTQSIVPPVTVAEMMESDDDDGVKIYFDDLPGALRGLVPRNALNGSESDGVFHMLHDLKMVADKIGTGEDLIDLARSLDEGELGVFFAAHRAVERNSKNEGKANALGGDVADRLVRAAKRVFQSLKGDGNMNDVSLTAILEQMAEIAWKKSIRGGSLAHTALIKPMDIAFQLIRRQGDREISFIKLIAVEEILRHVERTSDFTVGAERSNAITAWADLFFNELLAKGFGGDARRLIRDEKHVKAAYTTLLRRELRKASEAKKQASSDAKQ